MERTKSIILFRRAAMMLLVMMLTTMTAWATDPVVKTFLLSSATRSEDNMSLLMNDPDDNNAQKTVIIANCDREYARILQGTSDGSSYKEIRNRRLGANGISAADVPILISPYINGKVTKIEFTKMGRYATQLYNSSDESWSDGTFSMSIEGMKYNGMEDALTGNGTKDGNKLTEKESFTFISTNSEGIEGDIVIQLGAASRLILWNNCEIKITYIPSAAPVHAHDFTYTLVGNTLTATCGGTDGLECSLTNHQVSTSLNADDSFDSDPAMIFPATLTGFTFFSKETGATKGNITYVNNTTSENLGTTTPGDPGQYTASITINAGGTNYTLTKTYNVYSYAQINNIYPQLNFSTEKYASTTAAGANETVTITFTSKFGETLETLTVTGATTHNNVTLTQTGANTYTFVMPSENVTIGAMFSISEDDFAETGTNEYTIKTANGWGWFCFTVNSGLAPDGFNGKTVKLDANVSSSEMAGTSSHPFRGTFDGQGNTLTFNLQASEGHSAPFHYTDGATISNLHVGGTITGGDHTSLGGLVGYAVGNITISNCHVSTQISTTHSGAAWHGGVIAFWYDSNVACTVTGCVYDGLIYNPSEADATTYCSGFIGNLFGSNLTVTFTDCLYAPVAYGTGKNTLGDECHTFVYPNSSPTYNMTNCYYTSILGNRQGRPAATATTAPANLGNATTDHGMVDGYENGFLYNGNYYTPKYGDAVVEYRFNDWNERADVTINGTGENLVGVNITEEVNNIKSVTYDRTFTSGKAATVILPFNYTCNGNEGGKFYSFAGISDIIPIMEDGNQVTSLTANTPYVFMPTTSTMSFPNITSMTGGVTTLQPTAGDHEVTSDDGNWTLIGTYNVITWQDSNDESSYYLDGFILHLYIDKNILPTDCYLLGPEEINYYLVGTMTGWSIDSDYQLQPNTEAEGEYYILNVPLAKGTGIKAVSSEDNSTIKTWFPGGTGNDYIITSNGIYDIYFRPDGNSGWGYYYLYVAKQDVNSADVYFAKEGYATYYNGVFDMALPDDVIARIVTDSGERLTYQTIAEGNGTVPAGTAVMLYSQTVKTTGTAASRTLTFCNENSATPVTATNLLHGSDEATTTTGEGKHYKLSYNLQGTDIGWYWGAANGAPFQSGAHKAWLVLSGTSAPSFLGLDGDETTKITTTNLTNLTNSDAWFTLGGLKLDKAPTVKGVYIHNGRKQVIK